jgi:hypothetical protein
LAAAEAACFQLKTGEEAKHEAKKEAYISSTDDDRGRGGGEIQKVTFFGSLCLFKRMK